jgi:FtsH-binding integral membrane protein
MDAVDLIQLPWAWLVTMLMLAALAVGFFVGARRAGEQRVGWLLSGSVAVGLAISALYNFVDAAVTPGIPAAGFVVCIAIVLFAAGGAAQQRQRRGPG